MPNPKRPKLDRELKTTVNEDIISTLPACLLLHIISFLPTIYAVSTCLLSKTWKDLWMSTTQLHFSFIGKEQINKSSCFIDQVLRLHSSNITTFTLRSNFTCYLRHASTSLAKSWISAAVTRQVQELHLDISSALVVPLPLSLCNSNVLRVLKLTTLYALLELPSKICFSSLKTLHLTDVSFCDDLSFNTLFSGLPNIEELQLHHLGLWPVKHATISLPTLRRLSLSFVAYNKEEDHLLKVNAENLVYLNCRTNLKVDMSFDNMTSLALANIRIAGSGQKAYLATNLFAGLCYAKSLEFDGGSLEHLCRLDNRENVNIFPAFINLTALKINSRICCRSAASLIDILRSAPILQSFVIQEVHGGKWSRKPYPQGIECSLRNCSVLCFEGRQADLRFVKFVLKAAKALERLKLCCTMSLCRRQNKLKDIMNQLDKLPRASNFCVIEFVTT